MKKIILVFLATFTLLSCTQQKIGFVNTEKMIKEYKATVKLEADMKVKSEKIQQELPGYITAFQAKVTAYQKKATRLSAAKRQAEEQALAQEQQQIQQLQSLVQNEGQAAMMEIAKTTNTFIKEYGQKNGYSLILGTVDLNGAVMYGEDKVDLTKIVLDALNADYDEKEASNKETKAPKTVTTTETTPVKTDTETKK